MIDITQSNRPLWHQSLTYGQVEAEAEKDYANVVYNLHEDCLCLREELAAYKAHTESLTVGVAYLLDAINCQDENKSDWVDTAERECKTVLAKTPSQSLAKIRADAIRDAKEATRTANTDTGQAWLCRVIDLEEYANKIEGGS